MKSRPNVMLRGGPALPADDRIRRVEHTTVKLKLFRGNRYEHFEPTDRKVLHEGLELLVFEWSATTYVAE